ncbi:hypothetical protein GCM10008955_29730 [Deinococcus malanensis]|uniref:DUF1652 domain-containing protein n=1 Tax=Deinococcus malanensis TaxID=1706855 RepID=A0ABQ2F2C4_9DEIO|nr:hypothetical protein [Deinococcus malanensis]GGK33736.1 hypothetical protein GCM10008955_29730 [Deinococcus malanensis]
MTLLSSPTEPCVPMTIYRADDGRFCVCPTTGGLYVTIQPYGAPAHSMTIDREQVLELIALLQREFLAQP